MKKDIHQRWGRTWKKGAAYGAAVLLGGVLLAEAGTTTKETMEPSSENTMESMFDQIWSLPKLYKDKENPYIQEFSLFGRWQYQWGEVDSDQGDTSEDETRRLRFGAKIKFWKNFELKANANFIEGGTKVDYTDLDQATLSYKHKYDDGEMKFGVGRYKIIFSNEQTQSSKKIKTVERSMLVNHIVPRHSTGATVKGKHNDWEYFLGVFSGDREEEFSDFDTGYFLLAKVSKDITGMTGDMFDKAKWHFDFLQDFDTDENETPRGSYDNLFSTSVNLNKDRFGFMTDIMFANGDESSSAWGITVIPTFAITDKLEAVARFHYADADETDGLRAQSRYERRVPNITDSGRGEEYHSFYVGLNYYIYGDKLKIMSGVEWAEMEDTAGNGGAYDGHTWYTAFRLYF